MATEQNKLAEVIKVDPLRVLTLAQVCDRTGYSRSAIMKWLAEDTTAKRPGRRFPVPMKRPNRAIGGPPRLEWRELRIVEWMESLEGKR